MRSRRVCCRSRRLRWLPRGLTPPHIPPAPPPAPPPHVSPGPECLKEGVALPACVRSVEDHGYLLGLGIKVGSCGWSWEGAGRWKGCMCACWPWASGWAGGQLRLVSGGMLRCALALAMGRRRSPGLARASRDALTHCCACRARPPQGVSGFLPKRDAAAAGRAYAPGALVEVVVGAGGLRPGGAGAGSVTVSCSPEAVAAAAAKEWEGLNIGAPGAGWRERPGAGAREGRLLAPGRRVHGRRTLAAVARRRPPPAACPPRRLAAAGAAGDGAGAQRAVGRPAGLVPNLLQVGGRAAGWTAVRAGWWGEVKGGWLWQLGGTRSSAAANCPHPRAAPLPRPPPPWSSGTVDPFHLGTDLAADWRKQFRRVAAAGWAGLAPPAACLTAAAALHAPPHPGLLPRPAPPPPLPPLQPQPAPARAGAVCGPLHQAGGAQPAAPPAGLRAAPQLPGPGPGLRGGGGAPGGPRPRPAAGAAGGGAGRRGRRRRGGRGRAADAGVCAHQRGGGPEDRRPVQGE